MKSFARYGHWGFVSKFVQWPRFLDDIGKTDVPAESNRVFYFAIPPFAFLAAASSIKSTCLSSSGFNRLIIEKPFGHDLISAQTLAKDLGALYREENLLRMDHFLGYEICQNILSVRFGNAFLEPLMNRNHVAAVRVTLKEDFGTEGRGGYFTHYGIIRDVIQNHLLQMVTLVAMEKPCNVGGDIRDAKVAVLKAMMDVDPNEVLLSLRNCQLGRQLPSTLCLSDKWWDVVGNTSINRNR